MSSAFLPSPDMSPRPVTTRWLCARWGRRVQRARCGAARAPRHRRSARDAPSARHGKRDGMAREARPPVCRRRCLVAAWIKIEGQAFWRSGPFCSAGDSFSEAARAPRVPCVLEGGSSSARGPDAEGQQGQVLGQGGRQAQAPVRGRRSARLDPARPRGALPSASARVRARVGRAPLLPDRAGACSRPHPLRSPSPPLFLIPSGLARAARPPLSRALTAPNRARDLT